jgi:isoquinoline 1-oxidoreductase beta subunit
MHDFSLASLARDLRPSRRSFLIGATALGSSLVVGFSVKSDVSPDTTKPGANPFVGYVQIAPDDTVTIYSSQMDMGQGIYHGIATLVQEELDADWAKVSVVGGFGNTALYGNIPFGGKIQMTGGSSGMASSWERYRRAGATARAMLIAAAAEQWNVPVGEIKVKTGGGFGRRASVDSDIIVEAVATARDSPSYARDHTGISDRLCRSGIFLASSSFGMRFLTSSFPFSTRLM